MSEQLRLFDPDDYLDLYGFWNITVDLSDDQVEFLDRKAAELGVTCGEYAAKIIVEYAREVLERQDEV